ncbi:MAG TPA: PEP-CTERM/exosortase system-associated acyltransferase [Stellaceae bacterium]|nr:PEP-CTERM/exosortase system-associated acyltransferase [Stellaceae bacterium]
MAAMAPMHVGRPVPQPIQHSPPPAAFDHGAQYHRRRLDGNAVELFDRYLAVIPADSAELLEKVFRLRFQVYCIERGFEDAAAFPDGREQDGDETRSLHSLLLDRATGSAVGTVRLILPDPARPLPVFKIIGAGRLHDTGLPLATTAEVSRFAVAKAFRSRLEAGWRGGVGRVAAGCREPALQLLTFGLIRAIVMMGALGEVTHVVAMMEPALRRLLGRLGIAFHPLGGPVQHHGLRQPGWAVLAHLGERVRHCHPELWELATERGKRQPGVAVTAGA